MFELFAYKLELFAYKLELFAYKKAELYIVETIKVFNSYKEKGLNLLNFLPTKKRSYCLMSKRQYSKAIA